MFLKHIYAYTSLISNVIIFACFHKSPQTVFSSMILRSAHLSDQARQRRHISNFSLIFYGEKTLETIKIRKNAVNKSKWSIDLSFLITKSLWVNILSPNDDDDDQTIFLFKHFLKLKDGYFWKFNKKATKQCVAPYIIIIIIRAQKISPEAFSS